MNKLENKPKKRKANETDIAFLILKEKYIQEIKRLEGVRNRQNSKIDKEYFQGHIDAIEGFLIDIKKTLESVSTYNEILEGAEEESN